jgi:hypothetical protein
MNTPSGPVISGTATSSEGPVAMARVTVESSPRPLPDLAGLTGPDGCFTLGTVGPGRYVIAVHADGYQSARVECDVGVTDRHIDVELIAER